MRGTKEALALRRGFAFLGSRPAMARDDGTKRALDR
jgi:hypothetical protein